MTAALAFIAYPCALCMQRYGFRRLCFPRFDQWHWAYRPELPPGTDNGETERFLRAEP